MRQESRMSRRSRAVADFVEKVIPRSFRRRVVQELVNAYGRSCEETKALPPQIRRDHIGQYRHGYVETGLLGLGQDTPGVSAWPVQNSKGTSSHVLLTFGNRAKVTASFVRSKGEMVRNAEFRRLLLAAHANYDLFRPVPLHIDATYGLLLHGSSRVIATHPEFVHIVFPAYDWESYLPNTIDFMEGNEDLIPRYVIEQDLDDHDPDIRLR